MKKNTFNPKNNSIRILTILTFLYLLMFGLFAQQSLFAQSSVIINTGAVGAPPAYNAGPIYRSAASSGYDASRYCYLYRSSELSAAGITAGSTITLVGWTKNNNATTTGGAIFRIYMRNTATADFDSASTTWSALNTGATLVYENLSQNIDTFITPTYIDFALNTPFVYTGGSLEISTEWDISAVAGSPTTSTFSWLWSTVPNSIYGTGNTTLAPISNMSSTTNTISSIDDRRPFIKIDYTPGPSAVPGVNNQQNLTISPNPAKDQLIVNFGKSAGTAQIKLFNFSGQLVYNESVNAVNTLQKIFVSEFPRGIYFLQVLGKDGLQTRKVVLE